jgi:hypothetical protein
VFTSGSPRALNGKTPIYRDVDSPTTHKEKSFIRSVGWKERISSSLFPYPLLS